ncbi:hypothetical protein FACS1894174_08800 [Bacteroidia bacterium]|nr:hypothetical protein FACS1894203_3580 [Bacteroidia bacterium]GHV23214.1 hypothetical protein FACS1894174_08800 [Bacteroidia bacterium]
MIQRIQTIYLILIAGILLAMLFIAQSSGIESLHLYILTVASGVTALLSAITIFYYKKRPLQIKLCYVLLFLLIAILTFIGITFGADALKIKFLVIIPLISLVLDVLAIQGIKKDNKLIKSLDRLR